MVQSKGLGHGVASNEHAASSMTVNVKVAYATHESPLPTCGGATVFPVKFFRRILHALDSTEYPI